MNISIIWNDGSRLSFTCGCPNFTIDNTDKNVFRSIEVRTPELKTLTDDEIIDIWCDMETDTSEQNVAFARAILRKAQA
jgi:hypothetical protein